jgi:hypothetical protein
MSDKHKEAYTRIFYQQLTLFREPRMVRRQDRQPLYSAQHGCATFRLEKGFGMVGETITDLARSEVHVVAVC